MSFKLNPATCLDSYKLQHRIQYAEGTTQVYSNLTARSDHHFNAPEKYHDHKVVFFGLQGALKEIVEAWSEEFFSKPKEEVLARYSKRISPFIGESDPFVGHMGDLHDLGHLPILVKAIDEGNRVNMKVPLLTITNTHPDFFWLVNYLETWLSNETWKPMTSATTAYTFRKIIEDYAEQTGAPKEFTQWQGHDFSCRGMSCMVDAAKSGTGHLLSFTGTDTLPAVDYLEWAYDGDKTFVGASLPATEHSVMTMGGPEGEIDLIRRLITKVYPSGMVSIVSDSYDFWNIMTAGVKELKEDILNRKPDALGNSKVIFRPDTGSPADIICGTAIPIPANMQYQGYPNLNAVYRTPNGKFWTPELVLETHLRWEEAEATSEQKGAVQCLWEIFGGTETEKGFKVLDSHVGLIYGDSITLDVELEILNRLKEKGFASCNLAMGLGSFLYNYKTRDSLGFAIKATYGVVNDTAVEIYKKPKTGDGTKNSARGLLQVEKDADGNYHLNERVTPEEETYGELKVVFQDGVFFNHQTLEEIRDRLWPKG